MKKVNWRVRFSNPVFIVQFVASILAPILAYMGLSMDQITTWSTLGNMLFEAIKNPYVLGLVLFSVYNATTDPTTAGIISDSKQALTYKKPKKDK